jgi:hypothetical protein
MDKEVATKLEIVPIDNDLREGLPNNANTSKAVLTSTHLPNHPPLNKAAALAGDHDNKDMVPILVFLVPVAVPVAFGNTNHASKQKSGSCCHGKLHGSHPNIKFLLAADENMNPMRTGHLSS